MKCSAYLLLSGEHVSIELGNNPNVMELRNKLSAAFNCSWLDIGIISMVADSAVLGKTANYAGLYVDDAYDAELLPLLKERFENEGFTNDSELTIYVTKSADKSYKPTHYNPKGRSSYPLELMTLNSLPLDNYREALFFFRLNHPHALQSFSNRVRRLNIPDNLIPAHFFDPVHETLMNDPVIAEDQRCYDRSTLLTMKGTSPFGYSSITVAFTNLALRAEMEAFIAKHEVDAFLWLNNEIIAEMHAEYARKKAGCLALFRRYSTQSQRLLALLSHPHIAMLDKQEAIENYLDLAINKKRTLYAVLISIMEDAEQPQQIIKVS